VISYKMTEQSGNRQDVRETSTQDFDNTCRSFLVSLRKMRNFLTAKHTMELTIESRDGEKGDSKEVMGFREELNRINGNVSEAFKTLTQGSTQPISSDQLIETMDDVKDEVEKQKEDLSEIAKRESLQKFHVVPSIKAWIGELDEMLERLKQNRNDLKSMMTGTTVDLGILLLKREREDPNDFVHTLDVFFERDFELQLKLSNIAWSSN